MESTEAPNTSAPRSAPGSDTAAVHASDVSRTCRAHAAEASRARPRRLAAVPLCALAPARRRGAATG
eukprot:CAMPEP_0185392962 /NCGR_PEP_ID=MMETSP1364-20130426/77562_1 /TAXON_ID=38817 /ORGANISM="Gephyrocapsa oceanica, Strain RCC1303" /LENGTH=66 /DNA_ID=CAMNT_0027995023 /DNA_START=203 /DNA_END=399 /DNA_ORIENTATION=-